MTTGFERPGERKGRFVVLEGLDGSGISTQCKLLFEKLKADTWEIYLTKEPSDGPAGALIRLALSRRLTGRQGVPSFAARSLDTAFLALLFAADRVDHVNNDVQPWLERGVTVVCDRYYLSSLAYQSTEGEELDWLRSINSRSLRPDLAIFLDVDPHICYKRMQRARWHVELFEEPAKLDKVRQSYLKAIEYLGQRGDNVAVVDGNQPVAAVHRDVLRLVKRNLTGRQSPNSEPQLPLEGDTVDAGKRDA